MNTHYRDEPVTPSFDRAPACPADHAPSLTALRAEQPIARVAAPEGAGRPAGSSFLEAAWSAGIAPVSYLSARRLYNRWA